MDRETARSALAASRRVGTHVGLTVDRAVVLQDSNRLTVHLQPCDVVARIAPQMLRSSAEREVVVASALASAGAPIAPLDPRVEPRVFDEGGFAISLWAYHRPVPPETFAAAEYAAALGQLHQAMRSVAGTPGLGHVVDRAAEARQLIDDPTNTGPISPEERDLVSGVLREGIALLERSTTAQVIHGEPHPGNVIRSDAGLVFIDLETCCHGPVEFDIAHATIVDHAPPTEVGRRYPGADVRLVEQCWRLTLALAIAWRFEPGDDLPNGTERVRTWVAQLRTS